MSCGCGEPRPAPASEKMRFPAGVTRADIVAEARGWIGTPFHHQASIRNIGCDCIGLIAGVALALGIRGADEWHACPEYHSYSRQPDAKLILRGCARFLEEIPISAVTPADILLLRFERDPMHFALLSSTRPPRVIHALSRLGRVAEHGISDALNGHAVRAYSYLGIA